MAFETPLRYFGAKSPTWNSCPITSTRSYTYQGFQWMVSCAGDNIRVTSEFVKWGGRANVINVGLSLLCVYDKREAERYQGSDATL